MNHLIIDQIGKKKGYEMYVKQTVRFEGKIDGFSEIDMLLEIDPEKGNGGEFCLAVNDHMTGRAQKLEIRGGQERDGMIEFLTEALKQLSES